MLVFFATVAFGAFIFACYTLEDGIFQNEQHTSNGHVTLVRLGILNHQHLPIWCIR
jgi:hypothetical protein